VIKPKYPKREDYANDSEWDTALEKYEDEVDAFFAMEEEAHDAKIDMARFDADFNREFGVSRE